MFTEKMTIKKLGAALLSLVLLLSIPSLAMAEPAQGAQTQDATSGATTRGNGNNNGNGNGNGRGFSRGDGLCDPLSGCGLNKASLTEAQKTAYDEAMALYESVEDSVLADLTEAGVVAQADVTAYQDQRAACRSLVELDPSAWDADAYKAYYEAVQLTGDARTAALQALADAGRLTQAQADALNAQGQSDLWSRLAQNTGTNSVIESAMTTLRQARQTLNNTLSAAGIQGTGMGLGMGLGMGKGSNGQGNRVGGKGGRNGRG